MLQRIVLSLFSTGALLLNPDLCAAQQYPVKAIRIITAEPGAGSDLAARQIAPGITAALGQQVIVENRGGNVAIPADIAAKAAPDGYTLLLYSSTFWIAPLFQRMPYDPAKDFDPITLAVAAPVILVVHPSLPAGKVRELIDLLKARPGELNYGSAGAGSPLQIAAELFKSMAGVKMVPIPYKGGGPALTALISNQVQVAFPSAGSAIMHVKSGRLKALAVTSLQPSALVPGLPTVSATGLPGYEARTVFGVFAPAGTPAAIVDRLNREMARVMNAPEVKERFFNSGVEVVANSPAEFAASIKTEMTRIAKVVKEAGLRED